MTSSQYDILLCSETLVSDMHHVSEVLVPGFCRPVLCREKMPGSVGWLHTFEMVMEHFANLRKSVVVAKCCFLGFVVCDRTFMCTVFIATLTSQLKIIVVSRLNSGRSRQQSSRCCRVSGQIILPRSPEILSIPLCLIFRQVWLPSSLENHQKKSRLLYSI